MTEQQSAAQGSERLLEIGEKLAAVRKAKGLTQVQAAEKAGCTQSYLSAVENGKKAFSIGFVLDLINIYGVSYETVFGENHADTWVFETPEIESSLAGALSLLEQLVEN
ncbi:MAG: helix-turn-helix transcriptional regulator, partial [Ruminococcus sp.]|nr:helix-turn-helix transcriptional regulator [Ruminococcus sp.]